MAGGRDYRPDCSGRIVPEDRPACSIWTGYFAPVDQGQPPSPMAGFDALGLP